MPDVINEDEHLFRHLRNKHADYHLYLSRKIDTKKFARSLSAGGMERAITYLAGDPEAHAEAEYRKIMCYPVAWAHFVEKVAADAVEDIAADAHIWSVERRQKSQDDPTTTACTDFFYLQSRANMMGAYGQPGMGDRIAAEKWAEMTAVVQDDPKIPEMAVHRRP